MIITDEQLEQIYKSAPDNQLVVNLIHVIKNGDINNAVEFICELARQNEYLKLQNYQLHKFGIPSYVIKLEPGMPLPPGLVVAESPICSQPPLKDQ